MHTTEVILEFDKIKDLLCSFALSHQAKAELVGLAPFLSQKECRAKMTETTEARRILDSAGTPPLSSLGGMEELLTLCQKGAMLSPDQLEQVTLFLTSCHRTIAYLKKAQCLQVRLAGYGQAMADLSDLRRELESAVQSGAVLSSASPQLRDIRRRIENESAQIRSKLDDLLKSKRHMLAENFVSLRDGRYVVPVKKEYKNQFSGTVVDMSRTGGTYFMEPAAAARLQESVNLLRLEEDNEVRKILYTLTALVDEHAAQLRLNMEAMAALDVAFAKARLSAQMKAIPVEVTTDRHIHMQGARHPLLRQDQCVPLDFSMGGAVRGVIITGPNTGGKTVALKTVGLLSMMAQSGLHVPVESGTFAMHSQYLCDIGDGQSIAENLSTFSAHLTNIIAILEAVGPESLVLLDELGSGTDPAEGMGIAVSILEELRGRGCLLLATTHYPEVKDYAARTQGFVNARMAFDRESLAPLYRLEIGEAGESCALSIAKGLGFPAHMLERAHLAAYGASRETGRLDLARVAAVGAPAIAPPANQPKLQPQGREKPPAARPAFQLGDSVVVNPEKKIAIVFQPADAMGRVGVQIQGQKSLVSHKRLELKTPASQLYPPDYDFSIIFDDVETRKARHQMDRKYVPGLEIPPPSFEK